MQRASRESSVEDEDNNRLTWTEEMLEQLVETLYGVFKEGGAADNSFKKATFQACAWAVRKAYRGSRPQDITYSHFGRPYTYRSSTFFIHSISIFYYASKKG